MNSKTTDKKIGLCFLCQSIGEDNQSCTQDYLFLVDKRTCAGFKAKE